MVLRSEILVNKNVLPTKEQALPGRETPITVPEKHFVNKDQYMLGPFIGNVEFAIFGLGCFWGAERKFWQREGVVSTAVGYAGGFTPNPTYEEVCSGLTGHTEVVLVVYDQDKVSYKELLAMFWELHNPTQGMRQGNDTGTQYRSAIHATTQAQLDAALASRDAYQQRLNDSGYSPITTDIVFPAPEYYYAEDYHQQYLAKNPNGYCGIGGTGVSCPIGVDA